eukprot:gene31385-41840_t
MLTNIDVKNSKCGKKEDRDSILTIVRNEVGFDTVNSMIFERMRTWRRSRSGGSLDATAMYHLGVLYFDWGRYADAKPLLENCFRIRVSVLGVEHPDTISSKTNLANFYTSQSNFGK